MAFNKTEKPEWADGTPPVGDPHYIEPSAAKKLIGWKALEKPFRQWMNWLFNRIYHWINWSEDQINYIESVTIESADILNWNSTTGNLTFTEDIILEFLYQGTWYTNTIQSTGSPINIGANQALIAILDPDNIDLVSGSYATLEAGQYCIVDKASMTTNDNYQEIVICHRVSTILKFPINKQFVIGNTDFTLSRDLRTHDHSSDSEGGIFPDIYMEAGGKLYLDGGSDVFFQERADGDVILATNGVNVFESTQNAINFRRESNDASGKTLYLEKYRGIDPYVASQNNDYCGSLAFFSGNNAAVLESTEYASIVGQIVDATNGSEDGRLVLAATVAGSSTECARFQNSQMLLPDVDPPTANYMNRNSGVKGWISVVGGASAADYNVSSISHPSTGDYTVYWDTNFISSGTNCVVGNGTSQSSVVATYGYNDRATVNITTYFGPAIDAWQDVDADFKLIAIGDQ